MTNGLLLPRKLMLRAGDQRVVFSRNNNESSQHVLMKALLWALYLPQYPTLTVEVRIDDRERYKPDVVAVDAWAKPTFWGESGKVGEDKIRSLVRRYPDTHFAIAKWDTGLKPFTQIVREALKATAVKRSAPVDLLSFPADSYQRYVDKDGSIHLSHADISEWVRL